MSDSRQQRPRAPRPSPEALTDRQLTPLQAEMLEEGIVPDPDALGIEMARAGGVPDSGGPPHGQEVGAAAEEPMSSPRYEGSIPVYQWDIDPNDPSLETGEEHVVDDGVYEVWWQRHPEGLLYVSIQALDEDRESFPAREHPVGRNVVVNLVYDEDRQAVVAIYGTAVDFRPFVYAFGNACGIDIEDPQT